MKHHLRAHFSRTALVSWAAPAAILLLAGACGGGGASAASATPSATPAMSMAPSGTGDPSSTFPSASPVAASQVTIQNFAFSPAVITVRARTKATWTNQDEEPHTVVSVGAPGMRSSPLQQGDTFSYTFTT